MEVTRAAGTSCLKRRFFSILFNDTYSSHHQAGAPMIGNLCTISARLGMCIYTHILHKTEMLVGQKK